MATKRKQQTVQFLFEASPENNITRCLISKTSNTFDNNEQENCDEVTKEDEMPAQIGTDHTDLKGSLNTFGNNEEPSSFQQRSLARQGLNVDTGSDEDYITTAEEESDQIHTYKGILQERVGSKAERSRSINSNGDDTKINTISEFERITEEGKTKTLNGYNQKEQHACTPGHLYNTNQSHKPQGLEIHPNKPTMSSSPSYKNHNNFHNGIRQSPLSNPEDNNPKEQFPVICASNHLEAKHESTKLSLIVGGTNKNIECEIINNFNAKFYDEDESKYLHVIDCDTQEPVSVIGNFDYSEHKHQSLKGISDKRSNGFSEVYNDLNTKIQETEPNFLQDFNLDRQLPDQGNPRRLQEKQTKLHANIPSNNNEVDIEIENIRVERDLDCKKQPGSKVRNLIHDYEIQVQENSSYRKLGEKHGDQLRNILNTEDTVQSPYTKRRDIGTNKSHANHISLLNSVEPSVIGSSSLYDREFRGSKEIINLPAAKVINTGYRQSMTRECNASDIPDSNPEKQPAIPSNKHLQSLPLDKIASGSEDFKTISLAKVNNTGDIHLVTKESNASDSPDNSEKQRAVPGNKFSHSLPLEETVSRSKDIKTISATKVNNTGDIHLITKESNTSFIPDSNPEKQPAIPVNKHLQSLPLDKIVSGSEDFKTITAAKVNNTGDIHLIIKECNTSFVPDSNPEKQSPNARKTNDYKLKVGKNHPTITNNYDQSSRSDIRELKSGYEFQACTDGSQVTQAHWYDIDSPLQQSSQEIKPSNFTEENTFQSPPRKENTLKPPPKVNYNTAREKSLNGIHHKRWKSLGELDKIDQVEEYKLPEKLNKTAVYPNNKQDMSDRNNNLDTMYFNTIPMNPESSSIPRNHAIKNTPGLHLSETLSIDAKTVHRFPFPIDKNHVPNHTNNSERFSSGFDNNSVQTHKSPDAKVAKQSPFLTRNKYVPNVYNTSKAQTISSGFDIESNETLSLDYNTADQSPSLRKYVSTMYNTNSPGFENNGDKTLTPNTKASNHSPFLTRKRGKLTDSLLRISNDNLSSSQTALEILDQSPMKRSPSPTRKKTEELSGHIQKVNNSSDSLLFRQISRDHVNNLKDYDNNLSSSLTALETLDQSPMKRSPKIRNLVNIEYYDINSDEELNSKIRQRPRTKSLNEDDKTVEYTAPRREFKSSGDLRLVGLSHEEIKAKERVSKVDLSSVEPSRTHGKYTELYADSIGYNRHPQEGKIPSYDGTKTDRSVDHKPSPTIRVSSHDRNFDQYGRISQGPQIANYDTTRERALSNSNKHYLTEYHYGGSPLVSARSVEHIAHKGSHVQSDKTTNLTTDWKQNDRMKRSPSPLHNSSSNTSKIDNTMKRQGKDHESITPKSTIKRLPSPLQNISSSASKMDNPTKHYTIRDTTPKSIVYPIKDLKASQGKYNIAKAEEEWRKRYGRLPYNSKDPLHQSSDKEFGKLFQHTEKKSTAQSSSKETRLTVNSSSLEGKMNDTSSSSLFSPKSIEDWDEKKSSKNSQSKEFSTTLNQLSSYVLSGYKEDKPQISLPNNQENTRPGITVKYKRYYLDDEGDLSHILDDPNESPKLSMLVHAIIRLREVYSIQPYTKPQTPEHPINLGNPQLRDAIQNKPMSVVKDLIIANKSVDINIRSQSGNSALHRAAMEGDIDAIRILINHDANVNIRDRYGFQPVHQALRCHHYKAAMFLMDCGSDLMSYTSKRIQEFVNVKAIAKQYLRQTLKTPL